MKSATSLRSLLGSAAVMALLAGMAAPLRRTRPASRPTWPRSPAMRNSSMSGRSASTASAMNPTRWSPSTCARARKPSARSSTSIPSAASTRPITAASPTTAASSGPPGLDTNQIFIFDVATDPSDPKLVKTITDFTEKSGGVVGPHGAYALPGRMLISGLSNDKGTGETALVEYSNEGEYIATHWMPTPKDPQGAENGEAADGYGYDARVLPRKNVMLTSSFTGLNNYMRPFGEVAGDPEAMKQMGKTMVLWDFHARTPKKVFEVPGLPLEVRWAWGENNNYAFTSTALTSKLWLVYEDDNGEWQAKDVGDIGNPEDMPVPVDISLSADDQRLFVDTFMDGMTRVYDVSDPHNPEADLREEDRQPGEHGVPELGRRAAVLHQFAAVQVGQDGRGQRAVPQGLSLDRQRTYAALRDRFPGRGTRPAAPDAVRLRGAVQLAGPPPPQPSPTRGGGDGSALPLLPSPLWGGAGGGGAPGSKLET
jgi:hypothetical protein